MDIELNFMGVCVVDWHSSYRFYTEILGIHAELDPDLGIWASLGGGWDAYRAGSKSLIVELFDGGRPAGGRKWGHKQGIRPGIQVDDLEAVVVAARARGVPFTGEVEETDWGQRIEFSAPEGIRWTLPTSQDDLPALTSSSRTSDSSRSKHKTWQSKRRSTVTSWACTWRARIRHKSSWGRETVSHGLH
jgi:catechol 2,3-dioxygenase-like lactoylglutathione lyase family enzyme